MASKAAEPPEPPAKVPNMRKINWSQPLKREASSEDAHAAATIAAAAAEAEAEESSDDDGGAGASGGGDGSNATERLKPNTKFLNRFIGSVERQNVKLLTAETGQEDPLLGVGRRSKLREAREGRGRGGPRHRRMTAYAPIIRPHTHPRPLLRSPSEQGRGRRVDRAHCAAIWPPGHY
mmetsp:Transcript_104748/g.302146  ORF Transcript_104748/g.302146 Transcript_104748/m.302146 type:complete len:178 (-) Transcript_104748:485-1018(-)